MDKSDFLFELGCEELPSQHQASLANAIASSLKKKN